MGYHLQRNGEPGEYIKCITKKAVMVMKYIWSIGERNFKGDFRRRMILFDYIVKSILLYRAEIWGWTEMEK